MARNSSETVYLKAVRSTKLHGERSSVSDAKKTASGPAAARAVPTPDLKTFIKVIGECRQMVKSAQHQIEILVERNIGLQKELTELVQKEALVRHLAYHDGLTGLPNRSLLQDRFHQAMSQSERHRKPLALLMLDLDEFKRVNDKLGHASGDKLLQAVALRLTKGIRGADTACRYGGDEFVIMLSEIDSPNIVTALTAEIGGRLSEPYIIDGHKIHIAASVGVAVYPGDGRTFDDLMKQADIAMYRAKGTGHSTSITEQPKEDAGATELYNPPAPENADRMLERDLFIQDESVRAREQQNKHQQM
ncbi:diguanylate cyclase domain-containing protein [Sulfuricaulis sp.]|jgi:diguanylate cyclase (GGDEF)-like protein|uniref:diguanylate cyclase domain-containing protein n=1 Tax=Sulfuricaulis sp. TaxID=2003553 RepID=UPI0035597C41